MEIAELFLKAWPVLLAIITLIIVLSKLDLRVAVLEEKVKSAFEIINKMKDKQLAKNLKPKVSLLKRPRLRCSPFFLPVWST